MIESLAPGVELENDVLSVSIDIPKHAEIMLHGMKWDGGNDCLVDGNHYYQYVWFTFDGKEEIEWFEMQLDEIKNELNKLKRAYD